MQYFTPPDENSSFTRIVLDGNEYLLRFDYNYKGEYWTFGIYENEDTPIVANIKVVPMFPVNYYFNKLVNVPNGIFGVITNKEKIGRNDFIDGNAQFFYATDEEVEAALEEVENA
jgi:hypothetical protein